MKNDYLVNGDETIIFLKKSNGKIIKTLIDTDDLNLLSNHTNTWWAHWDKHTRSYYVRGEVFQDGKKYSMLHRLLLGCPKGKQVDHINHNTLDNRRSNLRIVTLSENLQNLKGKYRNNTSGIRGVDWKNNKWRARVQVNKKPIHIGYYNDIESAEKAVVEARKKYFPHSKEALEI